MEIPIDKVAELAKQILIATAYQEWRYQIETRGLPPKDAAQVMVDEAFGIALYVLEIWDNKVKESTKA